MLSTAPALVVPGPLTLRISAERDGGWLIHLGNTSTRPASGRLSAAEVRLILEELSETLTPRRVAIQGRVAQQQRVEEQAGRVLGRVFSPSALAQRLGEHQGETLAYRGSVTLVVDSASPEILDLPWELLAGGPDQPPLTESGGTIVRLSRGRAATLPILAQARRLGLMVWCPTPGEAACQEVLRTLSRLDPSLRHLDGTIDAENLSDLHPPEIATILVLVCHGDVEQSATILDFQRGDAGPAGVLPGLVPLLPKAAAVLVGVCSGGAASAEQLLDLSGRLLLGGARAVISTGSAVSTAAFTRFVEALFGSLGRGEALPAAAHAGRQAVSELQIPHPDSRPYSFRLQVTELGVLEARPVLAGWAPPQWPRVAADLQGLLSEVYAARRDQGWIGVEHLLEAWPEQRGLSDDLRRLLLGWEPTLRDALQAGFTMGPAASGPVRITPRLQRLARSLPEGATMQDLASALIDDPSSGLHLLAQRPLSSLRWDPLGSQVSDSYQARSSGGQPPVPATRFEVLWGPEDGRICSPAPGDSIGRWHKKTQDTITLYADAPVLDRHLRRGHLRYLGRGQIELGHPASRVPAGSDWRAASNIEGLQSIVAGDVLLLTSTTWLRALP